MDYRLRSGKTLGYKDSLDIELLCNRVRSNEWPNLLKEWRTRVQFVDSRDHVVEAFRFAVIEVIGRREESSQQNGDGSSNAEGSGEGRGENFMELSVLSLPRKTGKPPSYLTDSGHQHRRYSSYHRHPQYLDHIV